MNTAPSLKSKSTARSKDALRPSQEGPKAKPNKSANSTKPSKSIPQHAQTDLKALVGGQSVELLKALHILTREGQINQDSRRKLKQVNHLVQLLEGPLRACAVEKGAGPDKPLTLVDHGAGKSYLGFILYDRFGAERLLAAKVSSDDGEVGPEPIALKVIAIETRAELVARSAQLAQDFGFTGMQFLNVLAQNAGALEGMPERVDVVTALHACDSLSDDAIEFALAKHAKLIFLVPCCQAEAASVLKANRALLLDKTPLAELWRHPLHTRELGSQLTNVMRCLYLEAMGYSVSVTELVGWEHSMKNELIVAKYTGQAKKLAAQRLRALLKEFGLESMMGSRFKRIEELATL